jgi:integrase
MARKTLTDRTLKSLKPAPRGKHYDRWDAVVPGLGVRVSDTGTKTFVLMKRYGDRRNPTRGRLGVYGAISLDDARTKARHWLSLLDKGIDPRDEEKRQRDAELNRQGNSFGAVAEQFIQRHVSKTRKAAIVERELRREFIDRWGTRPIADITQRDVVVVVDEVVDRGAPYQAHNLLGHVRALFNWAIARGIYGIDHSPCDRLRPAAVIGRKLARQRVLNDGELKAAWSATYELGYPYGPLLRLLILTGQRKSEVAEARWSEFDLTKKLWTIPADRMKADAAHVVPLSDDALDILKSVPRFESGDYLFSTTFGKKPVNGFSKAKTLFDKAILKALQKDDVHAELSGFVIHDLRRTVRTALSAIPNIYDLVRELVIGHTRPRLHKVYDQYAYLDEKRFALDAWAARLRAIVSPAPVNIVSLAKSSNA